MQLGFVSASSGFRFVMEESPVLCISLSSRYGTLLFFLELKPSPSKLGAEKTDVPVACAMLNCYYYLTTMEKFAFFFNKPAGIRSSPYQGIKAPHYSNSILPSTLKALLRP